MRAAALPAISAATLATAASAMKFNVAHFKAAELNYTWQGLNWSGGCARSGCYYDFNITGPARGAGVPAFLAYCSGGVEGAPFDQCEVLDEGDTSRRVAAKLQPVNTTGTGAHLAVSYEFADPVQVGTWWNYTGYTTLPYNQFVSPLINFTVTPSELFGVA